MNITELNMQLANAGSIYLLREVQRAPTEPVGVYLVDLNGEFVDPVEPLEGDIAGYVQDLVDHALNEVEQCQ
jgi:hypothetical protein